MSPEKPGIMRTGAPGSSSLMIAWRTPARQRQPRCRAFSFSPQGYGLMALPTLAPDNILNAKILIVDNQLSNVMLLERMLGNEGYTAVATTMEPREVCELHRRNRYDLILLDLRMPGMDGYEVMEGLKEIELENDLPVLVVTAQPDEKERAMRAGAKDFVDKPFNRVEVLTRVRNLLEIRLLQDALRKSIAA
jgi:CheY-like chemotaxis protein